MKTKLYLPFLFFLFGCLPRIMGQGAPAIEWQKGLGGGGVDQARDIKQCFDGGYIVAGFTTSTNGDVGQFYGGYDYWVVKTNDVGVIEWQKSFGGDSHDWASSVQQTADSGFIVAGYTISNNGQVTGHHGDFDYWVVKLDNAGNIQWQKALGGSGIDHARSIIQTTDGGYMVAGSSWSIQGDVTGNHGSDDYWIVKLSDSGILEWQKMYGGENSDLCYSIQQTADGGYIAAGSTNSTNGDVTGHHGDYDYWIVKLDSVGTIQWQKTLGGTGDDQAYSIEQTTDGGYIVAGMTSSLDGDVTNLRGAYDYWVVKLSAVGAIEWKRALGGTGVDNAYAVKQTNDGGYVVAGYSNSTNENITNPIGNHDYWVIKLNHAGTVLWQKSMGGTAIDQAYAMDLTADGGCIVAGFSTSYDIDLTWSQGNGDYWIVKLVAPVSGINEQADAFKTSVFPNPAGNQINVQSDEPIKSIALYDNLGKLIQTEYTPSFSISYLSSGLYSLRVITEKGTKTLGFIKE
jgi:hypothetical protein